MELGEDREEGQTIDFCEMDERAGVSDRG